MKPNHLNISALIDRAARPVIEVLESRAYFAAIIGTGKGLVADFFSDNNLTNLVAARTDATVNFVWGTGSPGMGIPAEGFSTRWTGQVQAQFGEAYTFYTDTAGGVRLFFNGQKVIDDWAFHARRTIQATTAKLTAGQLYDVQLEYRDQGTSAVRLLWSSASAPTKAVIPTTQLYRVGSAAIAGGWLEGDIGGNGKGSVKSAGSTTITVTAPPATSLPTLAGLTLVNAQTDQDIRPLTDGSTIDLAAGSQLSVRANPASGVGSVIFNLDGANIRTESSVPLTIAGDTNGDYAPWTPSLGNHTLTVTPYSGSGATGTTGTPIVVHFSVINSGSTTTTLTLPSAADAYVLDGASTDKNFGQLTTMLVKNVASPGFDRRSFVRFDLTGVAAADQIASAKVRLFGNLLNTAVTGMPIGLYSVANTTWSETALTWTNQPAAGATPLATKTVAGTTGAWYEFDVTSYLKAQKTAGATAVAFMLDGTTVSQGYATFNSHEATSNPPQLVVTQNSATPQQAIVASAGAVSVPEGSSASFTVKLAAAPTSDVVVDVVRSPQGDADLSASPAQLTFTSANWSTPQTVTVLAAQDADAVNGTAAFMLQSAGLSTTTVTATESDDDVTTPTVVTLADAADAHVRDGSYATQNFGQAARLEVKNSFTAGFRRQSFVRFDLTGVGSAADITSAKVRLFGNILSADAASLPVGIYSVADTTWGENAITFNTAPAASASPLATQTVNGTTGAWYDYDITNYLKQQKAGGATAVAFALKSTITSEGFVGFNSDEATSNQPQLVVTSTSTPGPTPTLAGLTLVNAQTDQDIGPFSDGATIDFAGGSQFSVRADPGDMVGSVSFVMDAQPLRTESSAPLTIAGDNAGDYLPWTPPLGAHTLVVTPFSAAGGAGTAGTALTVHFTVIDSTSTPTTVTLADAADAHVRDGSYATQNFGQAIRLEVKNSFTAGFRRQSFVRFDLTGVGSAADITSAKVRLFGNILSADAASLPVGIYSVANTTWGENAITFGTAPATSASPLVTDTVTGTTGAWYDYDVTNYLKQQKTAGATAVAFALKSTITSEGYVGFNSDEAASNKPQLVVTQNGTSGAMMSVANAIVSPNLAAAAAGQHYVYKTVRGNGTILARINSLGNTSAASEAGLVIRPDTGSTSAFVDLHVTGDGHAELDFRPTSGGSVHSGTPVAAGAASWLMLVRDGNSFAGYLSPTGVDGTWQLVGTAGVQMATFTQFGLAVDAVAGATVNTATFGNVSIRSTVPLGGNLDFQSDRVQDLPFVDLVKTTRGFFNVAGRLAPNVQPPQPDFATTDANGWPTEDFTFAAVDNTEWNVDVKPGVYKTAFTGPAGVVVTAASGVTVSQTGFDAGTGAYTYDVTVPAGVKKLQLTFKNTAGQIRDVRVLQPGYSLDNTPTFSNDYLNLLRLVGPNTLRLMDFVQTNNNPVVNWSDRTEPTDATQAKVAVPGDLQASKGIAWEYAIDLANAVHKDVWVNVPIGATDDYVRNLAALLRDRLAPDLNVYVEYSNEVWNTAFSQYQTNLNLAKAEVAANPNSNLAWTGPGPTTSATWANRRYARRAKQISDLFRAAWTGAGQDDPINTRVRMILGGQASAPSRATDELAYLNQFYGAPKGYLYGVAVAPYINLGSQQKVEGLTKDQVLAALTASLVSYETGNAGNTLVSAFKTANSYGLRLEAYEGGIDTFEAPSKDAKAAAVLDPQIQPVMTRYLNNWYAKGGDQINWFTVGARSYNSPYGTWAITDSYSRLNAPKILAYQQVRDATPVNVTTGLVVYP